MPDKSKYVKDRKPAARCGRHSAGNPPVSPFPDKSKVSNDAR